MDSHDLNKNNSSSEDKRNFRDILITEGVNAQGYGIIAKMVMLDRKITVEAKAIYAYFSSYAGTGKTAFPSAKKVQEDLGIREDRYYTHFFYLKAYGYIKVSQNKNRNDGKFTSNIYTLVNNPAPNPDLVKELEEKMDKKKSKKARVAIELDANKTTSDDCISPQKQEDKDQIYPPPENQGADKKPYPDFPCTDEPHSENQGTNNNSSFIKNNNSSLKLTVNQSNSQGGGKTDEAEGKIRFAGKIENNEDRGLDEIKNIIESSGISNFTDEMQELFSDCVVDLYCNGFKNIPLPIIRAKLCRLSEEIIMATVLKFKFAENVQNEYNYYKTIIWNTLIESSVGKAFGEEENVS